MSHKRKKQKTTLNEAFASGKLSRAVRDAKKTLGSQWKGFGAGLYKLSGGRELDKLTDASVLHEFEPKKVSKWAKSSDDIIILYFKKDRTFLGATKGTKQIYEYAGGMTMNPKSQGYRSDHKNDKLGSRRGSVDAGPDYSRHGDRIKSMTGKRPNTTKWKTITPTSFRALKQEMDYAIVLLLGDAKLTSPKRSARIKSREGATALAKARDLVQANAKKYKEIIKSRVGSKDEVDRMVQTAVIQSGKLVTKAQFISPDPDDESYKIVAIGKSSDSNMTWQSRKTDGAYVSIDDLRNATSSILTEYSRYMREAKELADNEATLNSSDEESRWVEAAIERIKSDMANYAVAIKKYATAINSIKSL